MCASATSFADTPPSMLWTSMYRGTDTLLVGCAKILQPEVPRDDHALHFVGPLADLEHLLVAVEPRDRVLVHEAIAAVDLQGVVRDPVGELAREELRHRRRLPVGTTLVLEPRSLVDEPARGLDLRRHVHELELDRLEGGDRLPELPPLARVRGRELVGALGEPEAHRRDRDTAAVQDLEELAVAGPAPAGQILLPNRRAA